MEWVGCVVCSSDSGFCALSGHLCLVALGQQLFIFCNIDFLSGLLHIALPCLNWSGQDSSYKSLSKIRLSASMETPISGYLCRIAGVVVVGEYWIGYLVVKFQMRLHHQHTN